MDREKSSWIAVDKELGYLYCLSRCETAVHLITCFAHSDIQFLNIVRNIIYGNFILLATNKVITSVCIFQLDFAAICGCEIQRMLKKWIKGIYIYILASKMNCSLGFSLINSEYNIKERAVTQRLQKKLTGWANSGSRCSGMAQAGLWVPVLAASLSPGPYKRAKRDPSHEFMVDGSDRPQSSGKATDSMLSAGHRAE